jgi:hypothetical protein
MNRRKFLQLGAIGAGATFAGVRSLRSEPVTNSSTGKSPVTVAIPISVAPLVQRDLDAMFDDMRTRAGVNTLFIFSYSHEAHRAGAETENFHGGNYARPHMQ